MLHTVLGSHTKNLLVQSGFMLYTVCWVDHSLVVDVRKLFKKFFVILFIFNYKLSLIYFLLILELGEFRLWFCIIKCCIRAVLLLS